MICNDFTFSFTLSSSKTRRALAVTVASLVVGLTGCGQATEKDAASANPAATAIAEVSEPVQAITTEAVQPGANSGAVLGGDADFLPVDEAFKLELSDEGEEVVLVWSIAPDYYLYRHKFKLAIIHSGGEQVALDEAASFSRGLGKIDDYFGQVEVFYNQALARIPRSALGAGGGELEVHYQGCADAGLCYPVQTRRLALGTRK